MILSQSQRFIVAWLVSPFIIDFIRDFDPLSAQGSNDVGGWVRFAVGWLIAGAIALFPFYLLLSWVQGRPIDIGPTRDTP